MMSLVSTLLITSIAVSGQIADITAPPLPDFEHPVDYVKWYNDQMRFAQSDNALDLYEPFLYGSNNKTVANLAPSPNSELFEQLQQVLAHPQPWYPGEKNELAKWVAELEVEFYKPFVEAIHKKHYTNKSNPQLKLLCEAPTANLANGRAVGQMLFAWAWRVIDNTIEIKNLRAAICANLAFANHISCEPGINEQFFAIGHRSFVYDQIEKTLPSRYHYVNFWSKTLDYLEELDAKPIPQYYARSLYYSEAAALQLLQQFCTNKEPGKKDRLSKIINTKQVDDYFSQQNQGGSLISSGEVNKLKNENPVDLAKAIHKYYNSMRNILKDPNAANLKEKFQSIEKQTLDRYPGLRVFITPIDMPVTSAISLEAKRRTMHLFLHMNLQFKKTDHWPQSLKKMDQASIRQYRTDPFTGKDLIVKPIGNQAMVYSVGANGKDDGGNKLTDVVTWTIVPPEPEPMAPRKKKPTTQDSTESSTPQDKGESPKPIKEGENKADNATPPTTEESKDKNEH